MNCVFVVKNTENVMMLKQWKKLYNKCTLGRIKKKVELQAGKNGKKSSLIWTSKKVVTVYNKLIYCFLIYNSPFPFQRIHLIKYLKFVTFEYNHWTRMATPK